MQILTLFARFRNLVPGMLILALAFAACNGDAPSSEPSPAPGKEEKPPVKVPSFNRDSAYAYVVRQVEFGPRVPGTEEHRACKDWLAGKLEAFGAQTQVQEFTADMVTLGKQPAFNIIGSYNPGASRRILLAAHWDTRFQADYDPDPEKRNQAILGADDGASGVAVLLELARQLQQSPIDLGVDIIFFDAEDQGFDAAPGQEPQPETWCLGAQHWSRNFHRPGYEAEYGVLLDMVGAANARFPKEGYSVYFAPDVVEKVWKLAHEMGFGNYFDNTKIQGGVTDDHYFVNTIAKIPMIDIINKPIGSETGFGPYWHTHDDDLDVIDKRTLKAVGQVMLALLYNESNNSI